MKAIVIRPLTPELSADYLDFFDHRAFTDDNPNGPCYCTSPNQEEKQIENMVSEFKSYGVKETLRKYAVEMCQVTLQPKGFDRLDEIQRSKAKGNNALVAMQFGEETNSLRESIRQGITDAGYNAIFIDEVEHNDFITPENLKYIKDSKFVVADLTHQNNGAYFEEGYAMGLGKPVIQLCRTGVKLHFDIAQKNTIMWREEKEIPLRLSNRIKATID